MCNMCNLNKKKLEKNFILEDIVLFYIFCDEKKECTITIINRYDRRRGEKKFFPHVFIMILKIFFFFISRNNFSVNRMLFVNGNQYLTLLPEETTINSEPPTPPLLLPIELRISNDVRERVRLNC